MVCTYGMYIDNKVDDRAGSGLCNGLLNSSSTLINKHRDVEKQNREIAKDQQILILIDLLIFI